MSFGRMLLATLLGGLMIFAWGALAHTVLPLGTMGVSTIASAEEEALQGALRTAFAREGLYMVPGAPMREEMSAEALEAWAKSQELRPRAFVVFSPEMGEMMPPSMLIKEFVSNVLAALLAALILARVAAGYVGRVALVTLIGVIGWMSISVSYWTWYSFPTEYMIAEGIMETVGWFLAGLVMAAMVKGVGAGTANLRSAA